MQNTKVKKFYNNIAPLYVFIDFFLRHKKGAMQVYLDKKTSGKILVIGIGGGHGMSSIYNHEITGIDISNKMLDRARKNKKLSTVSLHLMDGEQLSFQEELFDFVVIQHVLSVTSSPNKLLKESHRVLKKGGEVIILNHFTPLNFLRFVDKFFNVISKWFCFSSNFVIEKVLADIPFHVSSVNDIGMFSYYKLIILKK